MYKIILYICFNKERLTNNYLSMKKIFNSFSQLFIKKRKGEYVFEIGDKVLLPLTKSTGCSWEKSIEIQKAIKNQQKYLYVCEINLFGGTICLGYSPNSAGDFFLMKKDGIQPYKDTKSTSEEIINVLIPEHKKVKISHNSKEYELSYKEFRIYSLLCQKPYSEIDLKKAYFESVLSNLNTLPKMSAKTSTINKVKIHLLKGANVAIQELLRKGLIEEICKIENLIQYAIKTK